MENKLNRMIFDCDEVIKVQWNRETYEIAKNKVSGYFNKKTISEISLTELAFYSYLPFLVSIEYKDGQVGVATIVLLPINVKMEISDDLFDFLISEGKKQ